MFVGVLLLSGGLTKDSLTTHYLQCTVHTVTSTESAGPQEIHRGTHLTGTEIAEMFGVNQSTVSRWVKSGKLEPVFRASNLSLFDPAVVEQFGRDLVEIAQSRIPNRENRDVGHTDRGTAQTHLRRS